jgi:hypothetical protein
LAESSAPAGAVLLDACAARLIIAANEKNVRNLAVRIKILPFLRSQICAPQKSRHNRAANLLYA